MKHRVPFAVLFLGLLLSVPAFSQHGAQFVSRPATIVLVARLESLSVTRASALSIPAQESAPATGFVTPIAVTTSWAVPANSTTMRIAAYAVDLAPGVGAAPSGSQAPLTEPLWTRELPLPIFAESVFTNARTSRTDPVPAGAALLPDPHHSPSSGALLIVAQAL